MRTKIITRRIAKMSDSEYWACRILTLGDEGSMQSELEMLRDLARNIEGESDAAGATAVMLKAEDEILAWALLFDAYRPGKSTYLYVHPAHRRKGYGSRLLKASRKVEPVVYCYPHDPCSRAFFRTHLGTFLCDPTDLMEDDE